MELCIFCSENGQRPTSIAGPKRIQTIIAASKRRDDDLHQRIQRQSLDNGEAYALKYHKNCVSSYTSSDHMKRVAKRSKSCTGVSEPATKRTRRSEINLFNFREHCLFCGEVCLDIDPKYPDRWRRVVFCKTSCQYSDHKKSIKDTILDVCDSRHDLLAHQVRTRVMGAVSDLRAAYGRYHADCYKTFMASRSVKAAASATECTGEYKQSNHTDVAFKIMVESMQSDPSRIWSSVDLYELYMCNGGNDTSRRTLVSRLSQYFGDELVLLTGAGVSSIVLLRNKSLSFLKKVIGEDHEDDLIEQDGALYDVANRIISEVKEGQTIDEKSRHYNARVNIDIALKEVSETLLSLLSKISPKLDRNMPASLIGNIITNAITGKCTTLQIALAEVLSKKCLIEQFYAFRVACSYDEALRFKSSAAAAALSDKYIRGIDNRNNGLVQLVSDNFDANISCQNGQLSTHSLAMILAYVDKGEDESLSRDTFRRLSKDEAREPLDEDIHIHRYQGPKKPNMPREDAVHNILPLRMLAQQVVSLDRAKRFDFQFLKDVTTNENMMEFGGFNTNLCREQGKCIKPATKAIYLPLIDMNPSDPDTMLTAMHEAQRLSKECGQDYTILTNDQQLYKVAVNVKWVYPKEFSSLVPRLGGMHLLMSFIGCIGVLMAESGLEDVLKSSFGGVPAMLAGKKFPQNLRALRMVTEELLRQLVNRTTNIQELEHNLTSLESQSRTSKLWIENLIKPVLLSMKFVRAEREGDWSLHIWAVKEMLPYFFAASHHNYARYGLQYLLSMERLPRDVMDACLRGEHVMRHNPGIWNGIWSDMFIETTYMRYGHGPQGIVGITLKPSAVKRWAYSMHICSRLIQDVADMADNANECDVTKHKEENPSRVNSDATDRRNLRQKLETSIDPLDPSDHPSGIVNIVTGKIATEMVNVDNAVAIGQTELEKFHRSLPGGFNDSIKKSVVTMTVNRKSIRVGTKNVYDTKFIYSRVLGLQQTRKLDIQSVLKYELSPLPTAMFDDDGEMRIAKSKSSLKKKLQVCSKSALVRHPEVIILDGCAVLWNIHWPTAGTVEDYVNGFESYILKRLNLSDVYLIFDRYYQDSIKSSTRSARAGENASRRHRLILNSPLPTQKVVLTVTENKIQLIDLICDRLMSLHHNDVYIHRLVITSKDPVPMEMMNGQASRREDLRTTHEEADIIIINQMAKIVESGVHSLNVVCDDTDVFILLVHYYAKLNLKCSLTMEGLSSQSTIIDIAATAHKHANFTSRLPAMHALSGCDTVAQLFGIGKATALKMLENGQALAKLGDNTYGIDEIIAEATAFMAACYGSSNPGPMSEVRVDVWSRKIGKPKATKAPELKSIPPSTEAFVENVRRAHIQAAIWNTAVDPDPPEMDPRDYGYSLDIDSKTFVPVTTPTHVKLAPPEVLKLIRCGCNTEKPCATAQCHCNEMHLPCTLFCGCQGGTNCTNEYTVRNRQTEVEVE